MNEKIEFHQLKISDIKRETEDAVSIAFDIPKNLSEKYKFIPGQYLTLRADVNGEDLRRPYSICAGLDDHEIRVCVKKVDQGRFSTYANESLAKGDLLNVMMPTGRFAHSQRADADEHFVGIAGGSGITPILSILKSVLSNGPNAKFTLFYGNRTAASTIFRKQLEGLKSQYMARLNICHILSDEEVESDILAGLMDGDKSYDLIKSFTNPQKVSHFYICGPAPMMEGAEGALTRLKVDKDRVSIEKFTASEPTKSEEIALSQSEKQEIAADAFTAEVTIIADGETRIAAIGSDENVLKVGENARMDLPFGCRSGICCTCRAKLVEGEVAMAVTDGLEPYEIEQGFILTCQAKPLSKKLVVDYDIV